MNNTWFWETWQIHDDYQIGGLEENSVELKLTEASVRSNILVKMMKVASCHFTVKLHSLHAGPCNIMMHGPEWNL